MHTKNGKMSWWLLPIACVLVLILQGCSLMPHSGPSRSQVQGLEKSKNLEGIKVIKVTQEIAERLKDKKHHKKFSDVFPDRSSLSYKIGPGDTLAVSIWETAPAILFRKNSLDPNLGSAGGGAEVLPVQMVMEDGSITIPFVGRIPVAGRTLGKIQKEIISRLEGKANNPHVMVRIEQGTSSRVAVIGDVVKSCNVQLTPRGENLLDALAEAGGVAQPLNKVAIQLSRNGKNARMPLDKIVEDPKQNVPLQPGDVIAAFFQPWTFSVLGATGKNTEVPFEAAGISLAEAMSRSGGLNDFRADPAGIFLFRFEDRDAVPEIPEKLPPDVKVPVVYQVDLTDPTSFFASQTFPMQDKDVVYVANMPATELQKFVQMVGMLLSPALNIGRYQMQAGAQ